MRWKDFTLRIKPLSQIATTTPSTAPYNNNLLYCIPPILPTLKSETKLRHTVYNHIKIPNISKSMSNYILKQWEEPPRALAHLNYFCDLKWNCEGSSSKPPHSSKPHLQAIISATRDAMIPCSIFPSYMSLQRGIAQTTMRQKLLATVAESNEQCLWCKYRALKSCIYSPSDRSSA